MTFPSTAGTSGQILSTNGSGILSWTSAPSAPVTSVNGQTGAVSFSSDQISAGNINKYYSDTLARQAISATSPLSYNASSGALSLSLPMASTSGVTAGLLSNSDWSQFNSAFTAATSATATNQPSKLVARDSSGNFSAGTITATLNGVSNNVSGTVAVVNGGTGSTSFTNNGILVGAGLSPISAITGSYYQVLQAGSGGSPVFGAVNLGQSAAVTGTLPISNGGTEATTPAGALANLGAAASGANSDITALSGLTTALSVAQGGTGATSLTANSILIGNGTGALQSIAPGPTNNI